MLRNKKGGVVTATVMGVGGLVVGVILISVIVATLINANLFTGSRLTTTRNNQTLSINTTTTASFGNNTLSDSSCSVTIATNGSAASAGETINSGNYTVVASACTITATALSEYNNTSWNITSSTTYDGTEEEATSQMRANFSGGVDNISEKIPTILLIVAVVFLFGALILLMNQSRKVGVGGSGGSL